MRIEVDPENTGKVDFPDFLTMMAGRNEEINHDEELMDAFKVWEKEKTTITT
jgi:calmodulin